MINAYFYLQLTTARNRVAERFRRLKQPKYLFGAIVGLAYFYFFFFRRVISGAMNGTHQPAAGLPEGFSAYLISFGALLLAVIAAAAWIVPSRRATLQFSEAEVAFLFPAPITRQRLIHFKLLRSQFAILLSTFFLVLVFRRENYLGGNAAMHAIGWWVVLSTLNLHFTAASFGREKLLSLGLHPNRRRVLALGILAGVSYGCYLWIKHHVPPPSASDLGGMEPMVRYFGGILQHAPISWLLTPFAWVVKPYFAASAGSFFIALGPALAVMAAHYWWVMKADVSFEEASIDQARQQAERLHAVKSGNWQATGQQRGKPRPPAFPLAAHGWVVVAFLWKNLTALGPFFRVRTLLIAIVLILGFHAWAMSGGLNKSLYPVVSVIALGFGAWLVVAGPMFMRQDVRLLVTHFDLLKGYPLRGWQVILGSLLTPIVILAAAEWLLLLLGAPGVGAAGRGAALASGVLGSGALGIALILPPLTGLMLGIPFAATLYFPAWIENSGVRSAGVEVLGQRLIFFAGYVVVLLVALLPAVICGGLAAFIAHWLGGLVAAVLASTVVASLILSAEFATLVWWLGERFEQFDLSKELPR